MVIPHVASRRGSIRSENLPAIRRQQRHHDRLGHEHASRRLRRHPFKILEIEAEQEGYGKGCRIIEQSGKARKGEGLVAGKQLHVKDRKSGSQLVADKDQTAASRESSSTVPRIEAGSRVAP